MPSKSLTKEKALERLCSLCSRSEQCENDIIQKLIHWGINLKERQEIIEYLQENRYFDNSRFARSFANDKSRFSAWGPFKIRMELVKKKIRAEMISEALRQVSQSVWKEGLTRNAVSKSKNLNLCGEDGFENRMKLYKYLIGKGFPSTSVSKIVKIMTQKQEEGKGE